MKIGIFDPYLDSLSGGEKYMLTAASCLSQENDVNIFWDEEKEIKRKAKGKLDISLEKVKFTENIFKKNYPKFRRLKKTKDYDLIIYLSDGSVPFVLSNLILHFQFPVEWVKIDPKIKFKISRVNKIICNSFFTKSFIDKKFGVNSIILYPPSNISYVAVKKENMILHVGRLGLDLEGRNFKKQDMMINAFKKIKNKKWRFVLLIGFRPEQEKDLQELKSLAKGQNIEIVENPSNETLWSFYSKAKIYWHASGYRENLETHPEKAEHFGISTVEAMGAGAVPVVISAGGQKEIVENGESGFLWKTEKELIKKTEELMINDSLLTKMSENAINRSKRFTGDRFCRELKEIIK